MNAVRVATELQTAESYVRELFEKSPWLSIDEVARECDKHCKRSLTKGVLSRIRAEVRQQKASRGEQITTYVPPQIRRAPFNPPHFSQEDQMPATVPAVPEVQEDSQSENVQTQTFAPSSKLDRSKFLSEWATQNPTATIAQARKALFERFGMAISTAYIADTLKVARQLAGIEKPANTPPAMTLPTVEQHVRAVAAAPVANPRNFIEELVQKMKENGVRKLEIKEDGTYSVELGGRIA